MQQQPSLIDFASGELGPDLAPVAEINALIRKLPDLSYLGYNDPQGYFPLRQALLSYLDTIGTFILQSHLF